MLELDERTGRPAGISLRSVHCRQALDIANKLTLLSFVICQMHALPSLERPSPRHECTHKASTRCTVTCYSLQVRCSSTWEDSHNITPRFVPCCKFLGRHIGYSDTNKKINYRINNETNLLSLINSSLAHIYCSTTLSNHGLIRFNKFVS